MKDRLGERLKRSVPANKLKLVTRYGDDPVIETHVYHVKEITEYRKKRKEHGVLCYPEINPYCAKLGALAKFLRYGRHQIVLEPNAPNAEKQVREQNTHRSSK